MTVICFKEVGTRGNKGGTTVRGSKNPCQANRSPDWLGEMCPGKTQLFTLSNT